MEFPPRILLHLVAVDHLETGNSVPSELLPSSHLLPVNVLPVPVVVRYVVGQHPLNAEVEGQDISPYGEKYSGSQVTDKIQLNNQFTSQGHRIGIWG